MSCEKSAETGSTNHSGKKEDIAFTNYVEDTRVDPMWLMAIPDIEDISKETYFSVAYCESEFRKAYGKSIINYLIDIRISEAKNLLSETSLPMLKLP